MSEIIITDKLQERIAYINARVVNYDTGERWVDTYIDQYGKLHTNLVNIERKPVDWRRNALCQTKTK